MDSNSYAVVFKLFLSVSVHLFTSPRAFQCNAGSSVNNAATFLMKTLLNELKSESVKILFASVIQHEDDRPPLSSGLARNGFYPSELQTKLSSSFSEGKWAYARGKRTLALRTVARWEKRSVVNGTHQRSDAGQMCGSVSCVRVCDWAVLIGIVPCGRVRRAGVDRTWAASCRDYISRLDYLKCLIWGQVFKRCHSAFKVDYRDI